MKVLVIISLFVSQVTFRNINNFLFCGSSPRLDLPEFVLRRAEDEGGAFNEHCVVGVSFRSYLLGFVEATAYFNNQGYHTPATALLLLDSALYRMLAGPNASIHASNYPMPRNISETAQSQLTECVRGYGLHLEQCLSADQAAYAAALSPECPD